MVTGGIIQINKNIQEENERKRQELINFKPKIYLFKERKKELLKEELEDEERLLEKEKLLQLGLEKLKEKTDKEKEMVFLENNMEKLSNAIHVLFTTFEVESGVYISTQERIKYQQQLVIDFATFYDMARKEGRKPKEAWNTATKQAGVNAQYYLKECEQRPRIQFISSIPLKRVDPVSIVGWVFTDLIVGTIAQKVIEKITNEKEEEITSSKVPPMGKSNTTPMPPNFNDDEGENNSDPKRNQKKEEKEGDLEKGEFKYENAKYHHQNSSGMKNPAPKDGQAALDNSVRFNENSLNRVGIDTKNNEFVVLHRTETSNNITKFHGHTRTWNELTQKMKNALIKTGQVTNKGKIINK